MMLSWVVQDKRILGTSKLRTVSDLAAAAAAAAGYHVLVVVRAACTWL
jgi:hypothetical protein